MQERIDLVVVATEKRKPGGLSLSVIVSLFLHTALVLWFLYSYRPAAPAAHNVPIARYVELIRQNPGDARQFVEAPGPAIERAPSLNAPLSDANRKASMPTPTGELPTKRPGDGGGLYTPPLGNPAPRGVQQQQPQPSQMAQQGQQAMPGTSGEAAQPSSDDTFVYREQQNNTNPTTKASAAIDWRSAIRQVKGPVGGGGDGIDFGQAGGGEKGTAEQGPLSFETQWYDWGPYAASMVSRIRVNWYANMPQLIRTGIQGVVTIRFTIQRDGRITDVTILKTSGHPPYDFAARKAIELSSPLQPLPADFPNPSERVTAMFYYDMRIP
ncbi:MAG: energy transducer TonB [Thermoanaerobaculia bacterium]